MGIDVGAQASVDRGTALRRHEISRIFRALADPTRRAVVERLARGSASPSEIARPSDMTLPSFARHLAMLEKCGILRSRKEGRVRRIRLAPKPPATAEDWIVAHRATWNRRPDQLQGYLGSMKKPKC